MNDATAKQEGTVKWFNAPKGYGFVIPDDGSKELFVHFTSIVADGYRSLNEGDRVCYDAKVADKGATAINVVVINPRGPRAQRPAPTE